ncbi:MAG: glutamate--tRNA ligase [Pseudomonadota bacterium]
MSDQVVCRFAPSPTGFLHIGGARTALFNWLYARARKGRFVLRIEDTDRQRSTDAAVGAIVDGLKWLELDWDGDPLSQAARADRHREIVDQLVADGHAYPCYMTPEELAEARKEAEAAGTVFRYDRRWRDRDPAEAPAGVDPVIRLKIPMTGETTIDDRVQGQVTVNNADLDDFIILRSDRSPVYLLSVVVDDHDMDVTHIIRGDDHLTNAAKQILIYEAMGWSVPVMVHIPLIHGPDGAKLSKRHGALGIEAYRDMGYLPQTLRNYLARLGWSHGDAEIFSTEEMIAWFDLDAIGKAPSRLDFKKMENLNGHYIRQADEIWLFDALCDWIVPDDRLPAFQRHRERLLQAMPLLKERAKTLVELEESARFLVAERPIPTTEKAEKALDEDGRVLLGDTFAALQAETTWSRESLEAAVQGIAEEKGLKFGKVAGPLRAALTGSTASPSIFDLFLVLGREESLGRIGDRI